MTNVLTSGGLVALCVTVFVMYVFSMEMPA